LFDPHRPPIVELERSTGVFVEPELQRAILGHDWLVEAVSYVYIYGHWPVVALTLLWFLLRHRDEYSRFRNAMLISGAIGLLIYAVFPVAPPRFLPEYGFVGDLGVPGAATARLRQPVRRRAEPAFRLEPAHGDRLGVARHLQLVAVFGASQLAGVLPGVHGASPREGALVAGLASIGVSWTAAFGAVALTTLLYWIPALLVGGSCLFLRWRGWFTEPSPSTA
jgi:uncharacterized membrane protein YkvA (DUF1232 family)